MSQSSPKLTKLECLAKIGSKSFFFPLLWFTESILSLYSSGQQQPMYGVPGGLYMQAQQGQRNMMSSDQQYGYQQQFMAGQVINCVAAVSDLLSSPG